MLKHNDESVTKIMHEDDEITAVVCMDEQIHGDYAEEVKAAGGVLYLDARSLNGAMQNNAKVTQDNHILEDAWDNRTQSGSDREELLGFAAENNQNTFRETIQLIDGRLRIYGDGTNWNGCKYLVDADKLDPNTDYIIELDITHNDTFGNGDFYVLSNTSMTGAYVQLKTREVGTYTAEITTPDVIEHPEIDCFSTPDMDAGGYVEISDIRLYRKHPRYSAKLNNFAGTEQSGLSYDIAVSENRDDLEKPGNITILNELGIDGNFEGSGSGVAPGWTMNDADSRSWSGNVQRFTPTAQYGRLRKVGPQNIGDDYYVCVFIKTNPDQQIQLKYESIAETKQGVDVFELFSLVFTATDDTYDMRILKNDAGSNYEIEVSKAHHFNLSQLRGLFPNLDITKEWMDKFMQSCYKKGIYVNGQNIHYAICEYLAFDGVDDLGKISSDFSLDNGEQVYASVTLMLPSITANDGILTKCLDVGGDEQFGIFVYHQQLYNFIKGFGCCYQSFTENKFLTYSMLVTSDTTKSWLNATSEATYGIGLTYDDDVEDYEIVIGCRVPGHNYLEGKVANVLIAKGHNLDVEKLQAIEAKIAKNYLALN